MYIKRGQTARRRDKMSKFISVKNEKGQEIDFQAVVNIMDDEIREELAMMGFGSEQEFFEAYSAAHKEKFGEDFAPWVDLPW